LRLLHVDEADEASNKVTLLVSANSGSWDFPVGPAAIGVLGRFAAGQAERRQSLRRIGN